jgi:hypothetical protein
MQTILDNGHIVPHCAQGMITTAKTEEIKVRVEPLSKSALIQIAAEEQLDLSDIVRRALNDMIRKYQNPARHEANSTTSRYVR